MRKLFVLIVVIFFPFFSFSQSNIIPEDSLTLIVVEEMPVYPGGDEALIKFISDNLVYPQYAKENNIQGKVFVNFVIDTLGKVTNVKVVKSVHPSLDEEAVRVISTLSDWKPGKQKGKYVRVLFTFPINFQLF